MPHTPLIAAAYFEITRLNWQKKTKGYKWSMLQLAGTGFAGFPSRRAVAARNEVSV